MRKILITKYLEKSLLQTRVSSETLYQDPNLFLNILDQNYQVSVNLLSNNRQTLPTDSIENSQNRVWFNATNELFNAYLVISLVLRVQ